MKNGYVKYHYSEAIKPYTEYPVKFCNHLADVYFRKRSGTMLDVCCGRGEHMAILRDIGFNVHGVDADKIATDNLNFSVVDVENEKLPFKDNLFDAILVKSAIEHIRNIDHLMKELHRVLKPGGSIIITTPDWKANFKIFYDDYTHKTPFTKASLEDMLKMFDFKKVKVEYFYHLPFTWKNSFNKKIARLLSFVPFRYTQTTTLTEFQKLIRFSKERTLLGYAEK